MQPVRGESRGEQRGNGVSIRSEAKTIQIACDIPYYAYTCQCRAL